MQTYKIVLYAYPPQPVLPIDVPLPMVIHPVRIEMVLTTTEPHSQVARYAHDMALCRFPRADGWCGHNWLTTLIGE